MRLLGLGLPSLYICRQKQQSCEIEISIYFWAGVMSTDFPKRLSEKLRTIRERDSQALSEMLKPFDTDIEAFERRVADLPLGSVCLCESS